MCTNGHVVCPPKTRAGDQPEPRKHNHIIYETCGFRSNCSAPGRRQGPSPSDDSRRSIHPRCAPSPSASRLDRCLRVSGTVAQSNGKTIAEHRGCRRRSPTLRTPYACCACSYSSRWRSTKQAQGKHAPDIAAVNSRWQGTARGVFQRLHILGSLGTTDITPSRRYTRPHQTMACQRVDEVHKSTVARRVIKDYRPTSTIGRTEYIPTKREAACRKGSSRKFQPEPQLGASPRPTRVLRPQELT